MSAESAESAEAAEAAEAAESAEPAESAESAEPRLEPLLVDPTRLAILALLANCTWAEFSYVRDAVSISDSALSKQSVTLEKHGLIEVRKGHVGKRPRTWLHIAHSGAQVLDRHVQALEQIVQQARAAGASSPSRRVG